MARKRALIAPRAGRITMAVAVGATALFLTNGAAMADVGVGIGAAPVTLTETAEPGASYPIGPVTVVNTGDEAATVDLRIGDDPTEAARPVPATWIQFDEKTLELDDGEEAFVGMRLDVPDDAEPGDYQALIYAGLSSSFEAGGSQVGAEAATRLTFTVAGAGSGFSWTSPVGLAVAGLAALLLAGAAVHTAKTRRHATKQHADAIV